MSDANTQSRHRSATGGFGHCPHCGASLADTTFARHKGVEGCDASGSSPAPPSPYVEYEDMPALEDAPASVDVDENDRERRRQLADELTEAGVWVGQ